MKRPLQLLLNADFNSVLWTSYRT